MSKNLLNKLVTTLNSGELLQLVDDSLASSQVLEKLGFSKKGQYAQIVRQFLVENEIDISHFTPNGKPSVPPLTKKCLHCNKEFTCISRKTKEQVTCSKACSNSYFRSGEDHPSYTTGISGYRDKAIEAYGAICNRCKFEDIRALEVHHKDRDRSNNDISNLEVLCCNCHVIEHK